MYDAVKSENVRCTSSSDILEANVLMNSELSQNSFIYEEGQEKLLAAEICEYISTRADRNNDLEINIINCFKPSATEIIFRRLRKYNIDYHNSKYFANYYAGELQIVFFAAVHDKCSRLFVSISDSIKQKTTKRASYSQPFTLDMYANAKTFEDDKF
jgi:hypothetical protein